MPNKKGSAKATTASKNTKPAADGSMAQAPAKKKKK